MNCSLIDLNVVACINNCVVDIELESCILIFCLYAAA